MSKSLNPQVMIELIGDDKASARKFYSDFLQQAKSSCGLLKQAYQDSAYQELKDHAHFLKTSAKAVGAEVLAEQLQELEEQALANNQAQCAELIRAIHTELGSHFVIALKAHLQQA